MSIIGKTVLLKGQSYKVISEFAGFNGKKFLRVKDRKGVTKLIDKDHLPQLQAVKKTVPKPAEKPDWLLSLEKDLALFNKSDKQDTDNLLNKMKKLVEQAKQQTNKVQQKVQLVKTAHTKLVHKAYNAGVISNLLVPISELRSFDNSMLKNIIKSYKIVPDFEAPADGYIATLVHENPLKEDMIKFRVNSAELAKSILKKTLEEHPFKCSMNIKVVLEDLAGKEITAHFWSTEKKGMPEIVSNSSQTGKAYNRMFDKCEKRLEQFLQNGSGWHVKKIESMYINIYKYNPVSPKSYIELPYWLRMKQACINVKNKDSECFRWAILSGFFPVKAHTDRVTSYASKFNKLNWKGITFPTPLDARMYTKFESNNPECGINVFILDGEYKISPFYISKKDDKNIKNLLVVSQTVLTEIVVDGEKQFEEQNNYHYVWIKNFNAIQNKDGYHKKFYCYNCLTGFSSEARLEEHKKIKCYDFKCAVAKLPKKEDSIIKFKKIYRQMKKAVAFIADFEALTVPVANGKEYQNHKACAYGYVVVSDYPELCRPYRSFCGEDAVYKFLKAILDDYDELMPIIKRKLDIIMTPEQKIEFKNALDCHICGLPL
jgi:hypothetical protein